MFKKLAAMPSTLVMAWTLVVCAQPASAVSLNFQPQDPTVLLGNQSTLDVFVDPMGSLIGAFDVIVSWDDAILDLTSLAVDPSNDLGVSLDAVDTLGTANSVNVTSVSLELDLTLFQNGADPVVLFSLTFDTLAQGTSALDFAPGFVLSDEGGTQLSDTTANDGSVTVTDSVSVPAPMTLALFAIGLIGMAGESQRQRSRRA